MSAHNILPFPDATPAGASPGELQHLADISYAFLGLHSAHRRGICRDPEIDVFKTEGILAHCHKLGVHPQHSLAVCIVNLFTIGGSALSFPDQTPYLPAMMDWLQQQPDHLLYCRAHA